MSDTQLSIYAQPEHIEQIRKKIQVYTLGMVNLPETLMNMSAQQKLILLQRTPKNAVKYRKVGSKIVPYVKIGYIERCLNFVTNFNRSSRILNQGYNEYKETRKTMKDGKEEIKEYHVHDAWVAVEFTAMIDGKEIRHCTFGTWNMYNNPATSNFNVLESARSMATKSFADILGIASDRISLENNKIQEARVQYEKEVVNEEFMRNMSSDFSNKEGPKEDISADAQEVDEYEVVDDEEEAMKHEQEMIQKLNTEN